MVGEVGPGAKYESGEYDGKGGDCGGKSNQGRRPFGQKYAIADSPHSRNSATSCPKPPSPHNHGRLSHSHSHSHSHSRVCVCGQRRALVDARQGETTAWAATHGVVHEAMRRPFASVLTRVSGVANSACWYAERDAIPRCGAPLRPRAEATVRMLLRRAAICGWGRNMQRGR